MAGYTSPHPILGIGVPAPPGKGHGPLPIHVGVPSTGGTGAWAGPLPFQLGVAPTTTTGAWTGPLPFIVGSVTPTVEVRTGGGWGYQPSELKDYRPEKLIGRIVKDDEDLLELIQIIVTSGILE